MLVKVDTIEQARRRFLVAHERGPKGETKRWRCTSCGWTSALTTDHVPEAHECRGIMTVGRAALGPRYSTAGE